jgi:hypothetical protein
MKFPSSPMVYTRPYVETVRRKGTLREFDAAYKSRRAAALARGEGFMASALYWRASSAPWCRRPGRSARFSIEFSGEVI